MLYPSYNQQKRFIMKKIAILFGCLAALLLTPLFALAQDGNTVDPSGLTAYFVSLAALVPLVTLVTGYLKKLIKIEGLVAQIVSWLVSIGLCFGAWLLKIGLFADITTWWLVLIYGFAVGLAANGFFKIEFVTTLLNLLGLGKPKPSPKRY